MHVWPPGTPSEPAWALPLPWPTYIDALCTRLNSKAARTIQMMQWQWMPQYIFIHICWLNVIASVTIASAETSLPWESVLWKATRAKATVELNPMENIALMCMCWSAHMQFAEQTKSQWLSSSRGSSSRIAFQLLWATVTTGSMSMMHHHRLLHGQKTCLKWV
jgi:hypothetical protein